MTDNKRREIDTTDEDGGSFVTNRRQFVWVTGAIGAASLLGTTAATAQESDGSTDPDGDGLYEDVDGDGEMTYNDVVELFQRMDESEMESRAEDFDFNQNDRLDFDDVVTLFENPPNHAAKYAERAVAAYRALQQYFYQGESGLYLERYPEQEDDPSYSYAWPFSQAMAATIDLSGIPEDRTESEYNNDVEDRLEALEYYWNPNKEPPGYDSYVRGPYGGGGDVFYDDNEWIALELIQYYRMTGDESALERARQVFELIVYGWDEDDSHPCPGGVFWTQASWNSDRNTVSTAPGAELGLHLYQLTNDPEQREYYFTWAKRMYGWVNECLRAPNGLYWDHVDLEGNITEWIFTYNQGKMIGASVLFYEITGNETYLNRAEEIADTALDYFGQNDRLYEEDMDFTSIFFESLLLLQNITHNQRYTWAMKEYANRIWEVNRDPDTNLVERGTSGSPTHLLRQSAFVQINALLAWDQRDFGELA